MINIEAFISSVVKRTTEELYGTSDNIQIQKTRKEFEGDYTVVVFPLFEGIAQVTRGYSNRAWREDCDYNTRD